MLRSILPAEVIRCIREFLSKDLGVECPCCRVWFGNESITYIFPVYPNITITCSNVQATSKKSEVWVCPKCSGYSKCGKRNQKVFDLNRFNQTADCFADRDVLTSLAAERAPKPLKTTRYTRFVLTTKKRKRRIVSQEVTDGGYRHVRIDSMKYHGEDA